LPVTLNLIADQDRADEETFWAQWASAHPQLLGALLDLAASVMDRLPMVKLERKPRMADYARILAAVDAELGTSALERYASQSKNLAAESLSDDSLAARIQQAITGPFEGTSAALLELITPKDEDWQPPKDWPAKPRKVTGRLRRLAPSFRKTGWTVTELPPGHENAIRWNISPPRPAEKADENTRGDSQGSLDGDGASDASDSEPKSGTSPSGRQEGKPPACPRHQTRWGPRKGCPDCEAFTTHDVPARGGATQEGTT
jgi:hypothetical protein